MTGSNAVSLNNFGYIDLAVPERVKSALAGEIAAIESGELVAVGAQERLVGHINDERKIARSMPELEPFLLDAIQKYDQAFNFLSSLGWLTRSVPFCVDDVWVNFQAKHEYNPPHTHSGILSYVIWVRIPFDLEAEQAAFPGVRPENNQAACFNFLYTDSLGRVREHTIRTTREHEWRMIMFPASMMHYVNPFRTIDESRVSVAGNIKLYTG